MEALLELPRVDLSKLQAVELANVRIEHKLGKWTLVGQISNEDTLNYYTRQTFNASYAEDPFRREYVGDQIASHHQHPFSRYVRTSNIIAIDLTNRRVQTKRTIYSIQNIKS
jgi:hypothetical protein